MELLAPAGNLEKLKTALHFGADAVYFSGKKFGLRAFAGNFNDEELIEAYKKMYYDNFFRELCSERGLIRAKKFTWEKCVSELLEFIEEHC